MRATEVKHAALNADFTDPVADLQGDGGGSWINHDVSVTALAHDELSGMQDTDTFEGDDPPATFLTVDGATSSSTGGTASATIAGEGEHRVEFWARDLAGNEPGSPATATVRIDKTAPEVAFTNGQDSDDPDKLTAPVSDRLWSRVVTLPCSTHLTEADQGKVIDAVQEWTRNN